MTPNAIAALCVGALAMVAATVLQAFTGSAPAELWAFAFGALSGGLGIASPVALGRRGPTAGEVADAFRVPPLPPAPPPASPPH